MTGRSKICAAALMAIVLCACGRSGSNQSTEGVSKPAVEQDASAAVESDPGPTAAPTATPTPAATPTPTPVPVYVRPSYANVISGADSYVDERGAFIVEGNSLIVLLPVDTNAGYVWDCFENGGDGVFDYTEREPDKIPYTYTNGKYGGTKTPVSEVRAAQNAAAESSAAAAIPTDSSVSGQPDEYVIEEYDVAEYDGYEEVPPEEEYYEEYVEESVVQYVDEYGNVYDEPYPEEYDVVEETAYEVSPVSCRLAPMSPASVKSGGKVMTLSANAGSSVSEEDCTYVYAPGRKEYTLTATSSGTNVYCLECTGSEGLDSGFILSVHSDESMKVTFDLVWYSFGTCVSAPDGVPESEASVTVEQAAEREADAAASFDSCVRSNNMLGVAAEMVEGAYWEAVVIDPSIVELVGNGGAFYHEDYVDYAWDVFTANPVNPGRTTAYFVYRTGEDSAFPRMQVADIRVADDMTVTIHVRRFDMGVEFD